MNGKVMSGSWNFISILGALTALLFSGWLPIVTSRAIAQQIENQTVQVKMVVAGRQVPLASDVSIELGNRADKIVRNCGYDAGERDLHHWYEALAIPSIIHLTYAEPIEVRLPRRRVLAAEAVFSLADGSFMGQPILHHAGRTTVVAKCDGLQMLELMCMPQLKLHFPAAYQRNCQIIRRRNDP